MLLLRIVICFGVLLSLIACQQGSGCQASDRFCELESLYDSAKIPVAERKGGDGNTRLIHVGYLANYSEELTEQMVVLEYRYTSDFHKKVYFPSRVCSFYMTYNNASEETLIQQAINALKAGELPVDNAAYQWAADFDFNKHPAYCKPLVKDEQTASLVSEDQKWWLRQQGETIIFKALDWMKPGVQLYLSAGEKP